MKMNFFLKVGISLLNFLVTVGNTICDIIEWTTGYVVFDIGTVAVNRQLTARQTIYLENEDIRKNFYQLLTHYQQSNLTPCGRAFVLSRIFLALDNGCYFEDSLTNFTEYNDIKKIMRPIILIGMGRSGTTLLHNLLAEDPQFYCPNLLQMRPQMRHGSRNIFNTLASIRTYLSFKHIHDVKLNAPEEIGPLLESCFMSYTCTMGASGNAYFEQYLQSLDSSIWRYFYSKVKCVLEYLAYTHHPRHQKLVLKHHINYMDIHAIVEVFPDAIFVNTIRDPKDCIPSFCSSYHAVTVNKLRNPAEHQTAIGPTICELSARKAAEFVNFRAEVSSEKAVFVDIRYTDLVKEPIETVSVVYKAADMKLTDDVKSKMATYLNNNKQHKYGKHKYTLQQYGLNEAVVDDAFKPYTQFVDI